MSRAAHNTTAPWLLPLAVFLLVVTALLPHRYSTPWVRPVGQQTQLVLAPISQLFTSLGRLFTPPRHDPADIDPDDARERIDELERRNRQLEMRVEELVRENEILASGSSLLPPVEVRTVRRPVVAPGGRLMRIRGGTSDGITRSTIAIAGREQLVGRVETVESRTSVVQPITAPDAPKMRARVLMTAARDPGVTCLLTPVGDGSLIGPTEVLPDGFMLEVGQTVVLDDPEAWPAHAQMYVVGLVEQVEDFPTSATRKIVTVRPTVQVRRVAEVYLRIPIDEPTEGSGG